MEVYKELLKIGIKDLEASKLLFENQCYPQAAFNYHQSLEKTIKSFSLSIKIITEKDLKP
ncbi:HEPN domain-containing protein [Halanaerobium praevalens]|uniref:HEPN domain protein n=1 Tax=Halanaerobium praevalens (strain ATCC 33744 / DSM 2228 / GSL) TaxID=572479 RepID=E3DLH5_HALPG|nr:HEPN domain-containing protein [Halanaerobium praevalens]ADO77214.1 HEPN domain protein [Halanaerobium praevalens DSM 2228]